MKKQLCLVLTAALMLSTVAGVDVQAAKKPTLNKKNITLTVGKTTTLKLKNNKKKVKWSSSKKSVATVSKKGKVTAKEAGKAKITAKAGKKKYVCNVTVKDKSERKNVENSSVISTSLVATATVTPSETASASVSTPSNDNSGETVASPSPKATSTPEITSTPEATSSPEPIGTPEPSESIKDETEIQILKDILAEQKEQGVDVTGMDNFDNNFYYSWDKTGHVTAINWCHKGLKGDISFAGLTGLTLVWCNDNQLTSLDVSQNAALKSLLCTENPFIKSLDVSQNTALESVYCGISVTVTGCDESIISRDSTPFKDENEVQILKDILADQKELGVDVTSLEDFNGIMYKWDENGHVTSIDWLMKGLKGDISFAGLTGLTVLGCFGNQLTSLDVSQNTALTKLDCAKNQISSLDVSRNAALESLACYGNQLTSLDVSQNTALTYFSCDSKVTVTGYEEDKVIRW